MTEIITCSIDTTDRAFLKEERLSPSKILRRAIAELKNEDNIGLNLTEAIRRIGVFQAQAHSAREFMEAKGLLEEFLDLKLPGSL